MQAELDRSRMLNRKLNERIAATESTVRQQADRVNKLRAALSKCSFNNRSVYLTLLIIAIGAIHSWGDLIEVWLVV